MKKICIVTIDITIEIVFTAVIASKLLGHMDKSSIHKLKIRYQVNKARIQIARDRYLLLCIQLCKQHFFIIYQYSFCYFSTNPFLPSFSPSSVVASFSTLAVQYLFYWCSMYQHELVNTTLLMEHLSVLLVYHYAHFLSI